MSSKIKGIPLKGLKQGPILVPQELLRAQADLGVYGVLLWIHLASLAQRGEPVLVHELAELMGVDRSAVETHLAILGDRGWINDEGMEIRLSIPAELPSLRGMSAETQRPEPEAAAARRFPAMLDADQAQFEWLVDFWSRRVGSAAPEVMEKFAFWLEEKGMAADVLAVAVEEMCSRVPRPTTSYFEAVLRSWYNEGIREYQDLLERPELAKALPGRSQSRISPGAEKKWKELFPDEFE